MNPPARGCGRPPAVATAAALALLLVGCSTSTTHQRSATTDSPTPLPTSATGQGTAIEIQIGDVVLDGRLGDTPASQALVDQLPLTMRFSDLNDAEKIARLPQELPMYQMPAGDDPVPGDIGYYAPSGNVVLYYGDVGYWDGIARIGTLDSTLAAIADQREDFDATIRLVD